jgi:hypothetical protein
MIICSWKSQRFKKFSTSIFRCYCDKMNYETTPVQEKKWWMRREMIHVRTCQCFRRVETFLLRLHVQF